MRVGILGGTFDPIHSGHLAAARAGLACARLDEVLLVPAGVPPHKSLPHATAEERLAMCRLAVEGVPGVGVWDVEVRRPGPSFTVDTLLTFREQRPGDLPLLLLGWDAAVQIRSWDRWELLLELADLVLFPRPGSPDPKPRDIGRAGLTAVQVTVCSEETPEISATDLRARLVDGGALTGLVPARVEAYIRARHLYGSRVGG